MVASASSPEVVSSSLRMAADRWPVLFGNSFDLFCLLRRSEKASALTCMFENVAELDPNLKPD